jgi:hypothetical protein
MSANVTAHIDAGEGLTIPFESVLPTGSQSLVFVERGLGKLEPSKFALDGSLLSVMTRMRSAIIKSSTGGNKESVLCQAGTS